MLKETKRQLYMNRNSYWVAAVIAVGVALLLTALMVILVLSTDGPETLPLGTLAFYAAAAMYAIFYTMGKVSTDFNIALKMGATRRQYLPVNAGLSLVFSSLLASLGLVYYQLEFALLQGLGGTLDSELNLAPPLLWILGFAVAAVVVGNWSGALMLRYGRKGFWVIWGIWMLYFFGNSVLGGFVDSGRNTGIANAVQTVSVWLEGFSLSLLGGLLVLAAIAILVHTCWMLHDIKATD